MLIELQYFKIYNFDIVISLDVIIRCLLFNVITQI